MKKEESKSSNRWKQMAPWLVGGIVAACLVVAGSWMRGKAGDVSAWLDRKKAADAIEFGRDLARDLARREALEEKSRQERWKVAAEEKARRAKEEAPQRFREQSQRMFERIMEEQSENNITGVVNWIPLIYQLAEGGNEHYAPNIVVRFEGEWAQCMVTYRAFTESMRHAKAIAGDVRLQALGRISGEVACGSGAGNWVVGGRPSIRFRDGVGGRPGAAVVAPEYRVPSMITPESRRDVEEIVDLDWTAKRSDLLVSYTDFYCPDEERQDGHVEVARE